MKPLIFLTDDPSAVPVIENIARSVRRELDYFLHSTEDSNSHQFDFRNAKKINSLAEDGKTFVFYLHGILAVYVIENFLSSLHIRDVKIILILSALNEFLLRPNKDARIEKTIDTLLSEKANNFAIIKIFLTEDVYVNHLKRYDFRKNSSPISFKDLVVPLELAFTAIANMNNEKRVDSTTVFFINEKVAENYQDYFKFLKTKTFGITVLQIIGKIFPTDFPLFEHANMISAISKLLENAPLLQNIFPLRLNQTFANNLVSGEKISEFINN